MKLGRALVSADKNSTWEQKLAIWDWNTSVKSDTPEEGVQNESELPTNN